MNSGLKETSIRWGKNALVGVGAVVFGVVVVIFALIIYLYLPLAAVFLYKDNTGFFFVITAMAAVIMYFVCTAQPSTQFQSEVHTVIGILAGAFLVGAAGAILY